MKPIKIIAGLALATFGVGYVSAAIETPTFAQVAVPAALLMAVLLGIAVGLEALTEERSS